MKELRKVKIDEIRPYPNNPRLNDDAVEAVADVYCNGKKARAESRAVVSVIKGYLK